MSLLLHEVESLFVQRANEVPIHCSLPFPTKGLFFVTWEPMGNFGILGRPLWLAGGP
jgi:hypothetical protein